MLTPTWGEGRRIARVGHEAGREFVVQARPVGEGAVVLALRSGDDAPRHARRVGGDPVLPSGQRQDKLPPLRLFLEIDADLILRLSRGAIDAGARDRLATVVQGEQVEIGRHAEAGDAREVVMIVVDARQQRVGDRAGVEMTLELGVHREGGQRLLEQARGALRAEARHPVDLRVREIGIDAGIAEVLPQDQVWREPMLEGVADPVLIRPVGVERAVTRVDPRHAEAGEVVKARIARDVRFLELGQQRKGRVGRGAPREGGRDREPVVPDAGAGQERIGLPGDAGQPVGHRAVRPLHRAADIEIALVAVEVASLEPHLAELGEDRPLAGHVDDAAGRAQAV